ncbi:TPA: Com family DNA-binding transcriptional regulator [Burkholderia cenocepacia]|uniref:Com family DNA-binding transcriptional regulator n=1 Tax=Burkholderia cepacia complex TaxID=87882 RepID=UPI00286FE4DB|nr:Com family DNA-binding transcriptional regulator [Burkholderia pseudomultivorans]
MRLNSQSFYGYVFLNFQFLYLTTMSPRGNNCRWEHIQTCQMINRSACPTQDIRCGSCNRKLGAGEYIRLTIKCPRCRAMNVLRAERPVPAGHRASDMRESPHATPDLR